VGGDAEIVPGGGFQVQNHVIVVRLHIVGDLVPFDLITTKVKNLRQSSKVFLKYVLPFLALYHKVRHGATTIFPGLEVQRYGVRGDFNEAWLLRQLGLLSLGTGVQYVRSFASSNAKIGVLLYFLKRRYGFLLVKSCGIDLITGAAQQTLNIVLL